MPETPNLVWNKKKFSGLVAVSKCLSALKPEKGVFLAFFTICFGPNTNIEIIVVICLNIGTYQKLVHETHIFKDKNYEIKKNKKINFPNGVPPVGPFFFKSYFCNKIMNT